MAIARLCQCPERGDLHFYFLFEKLKKERWLCQCPERGDLHFHLIIDNTTFETAVCQCPERGDLHFHSFDLEKYKIMQHSVNALNGATSISTGISGTAWVKDEKCVNALNGATSISTLSYYYNILLKCCVNALNGATSISTKELYENKDRNNSVSMPWMGRPPFPLAQCPAVFRLPVVCQCPEWGDLHFHTCLREPAWIKGSRARFCKYFPEYSEKGVFEGKIWHVHSLFIFGGRNEDFSVFQLSSL